MSRIIRWFSRGIIGVGLAVIGLVGFAVAPASARDLPVKVHVSTSSWTPVGEMRFPRIHHQATLLRDGRVLVVGGDVLIGSSRTSSSATAELFDPSTRTWSRAADLSVGRSSFTLTNLNDGRVLVAGGFTCTNGCAEIVRSAEIYDPSSNRWTTTSPMGTPRYDHAAALLSDGRVLVAGGGVRSAEIYDPMTGQWSPTAAMGDVRRGLSATSLQDGRVLIAGGWGCTAGPGCRDTGFRAEVFSPSTMTWSETGGMPSGHALHDALLLPDGRVFVIGGFESTGRPTAAVVWNPVDGGWTKAARAVPLSGGHGLPRAVVVPDGRVFVAGGYSALGPNGQVSAYWDPASNKWTPALPMTNARSEFTMTVLGGGSVLAAGAGTCPNRPGSSAEVFETGPMADAVASLRLWSKTLGLDPCAR